VSAVPVNLINDTFPKGGFPGGNGFTLHSRNMRSILNRAMAEQWDYESVKLVVGKIRDLAIAGDVGAAKLMFDRIEPLQLLVKHEHTITAEIVNSTSVDEMQLLAEFQRRKQIQSDKVKTENPPLISESK
jgi:hypothetical protein